MTWCRTVRKETIEKNQTLPRITSITCVTRQKQDSDAMPTKIQAYQKQLSQGAFRSKKPNRLNRQNSRQTSTACATYLRKIGRYPEFRICERSPDSGIAIRIACAVARKPAKIAPKLMEAAIRSEGLFGIGGSASHTNKKAATLKIHG